MFQVFESKKYPSIDPDQTVYIVDDKNQVTSYRREELYEAFTHHVNTAYGIEPMIHLRGNELWSWGENGMKPEMLVEFSNYYTARRGLLRAREIEYLFGSGRPAIHLAEDLVHRKSA